MTETTQQPLDLNQKMYFHLVLADVVFSTVKGVTSHRTQFMTQSPEEGFPAARIHQLQNSAAMTVRQKLNAKEAASFHVHDVLILSLAPCGHMTNEEFYGPGETVEAGTEAGASASASVAAGEKAGDENTVVPFDRKD